ncbi:MAG: GNAT family N-acetyltransferase [Chitinophagaceae bacterium]|nr:GNAT family N-acetyltransferase [Chitinophagaceae bacterium]
MIEISTDQHRIDVNYVHQYLSTQSYWAQEIPIELVRKSIEHSLCFAVFKENKQIGFARMVTDQATFCYLCDVFIDEQERGNGYAKLLMEAIMKHKELQGLRRYMLATKDAHTLYEPFGFKALQQPDRIMEIKVTNPYE